MKASETLIQKLKEFEGCKLKAYKDCVGVPTIGIGHTKHVNMAMVITEKQAIMYLKEDLADIEDAVTRLHAWKTQGQFDAVLDFAFNLGINNLRKSTLLKYIKAGKSNAEIGAQFMRWNKAGGKVYPGLTKRRAWEAKRWTE